MLRYFFSREFFLTLVGLIGGAVLLYLMIFFWFLPAYTRHGEGVLVPDVSQMRTEEAIKALETAHLNPVLLDSQYIETLPPGAVIKQYPAPYSRVKPNRSISLTINKRQPPVVALPDIKNISLYQAKARLESWRLGVGKVTRIPDNAENQVLSVLFENRELKTGDLVPQGSRIDLNVGGGLNTNRVAAPDLSGLSYDEALSTLRGLGLNLGGIAYNPNGPNGQVFGQRPRAGDSLRVGEAVDLFIYGQIPQENEAPIMENVGGGNTP
ncbi:MAG: PASTA domain-containing protein [Bacteroidia bacterium]|nr:PASTA domain-containing protein [Bacteroidia bacterium]